MTLNKVDFKTKSITRDKEEHFIVTKGSTHQKDIRITNVYTPSKKVSKYMNQAIDRNKGTEIHK